MNTLSSWHKTNEPPCVIEPLPPDPYDLPYADPPLAFKPRGRNGDGRSPQHHYRCIPFPQLCAMPVARITACNSILGIWAYGPRLSDTLQLIEAWGQMEFVRTHPEPGMSRVEAKA